MTEDKNTREMMANSLMELADTDFERRVMVRIGEAAARKAAVHNGALYFVLIIMAETLVFFWFRSRYVSPTDFAIKLGELPRQVMNEIGVAGNWIFEFQGFILPFLVLLSLRKWIDSRLKYS